MLVSRQLVPLAQIFNKTLKSSSPFCFLSPGVKRRVQEKKKHRTPLFFFCLFFCQTCYQHNRKYEKKTPTSPCLQRTTASRELYLPSRRTHTGEAQRTTRRDAALVLPPVEAPRGAKQADTLINYAIFLFSGRLTRTRRHSSGKIHKLNIGRKKKQMDGAVVPVGD